MPFKPTPDQSRAIQIPIGGTIAVSAGAGTGKTSVLSEVVAREMVCAKGIGIGNLLVLTFTRKAAAEMAERIEKRLIELAASDPANEARLKREANEVADAAIETIDAFAARLIREHADAAGIDPGFEVLEENLNLRLGETVALDCLERWRENPPHENWPALLEETRTPDWPGLLVSLDSHLATRRAIDMGSLLLGRGRREPVVENVRIKAENEIRKAIDEFREEMLQDLDGYEGKLGEVARQGLKKGNKYGEQADAIIADINPLRKWLRQRELDWDNPIVDKVINWELWSRDKRDPGRTSVLLTALKVRGHLGGKGDSDADECGTLKSAFIDSRILLNRMALSAAIIEFHDAFLEARRKESALSFSDCEVVALELLENHPEIRDQYRSRFEYVVVDEFQDINPLQKDLIFALSRPSAKENHLPSNLYLVGDERQSIYGFRDADWTLLRDIRTKLQGLETETSGNRLLYDNFRSRPELLNLVNHSFRAIWPDKAIHSDLHPAFEPYLKAEPGDLPAEAHIEMHVVGGADIQSRRMSEAWVIARRLAELVRDEGPSVWERGPEGPRRRPIRWGDCALLFRTRKLFPVYEEAFASLGIPCRTEAGAGFWDQQEIADIIALLTCLSPSSDNLDWAVLLRSPWVGLSDNGLLQIARDAGSGRWDESISGIELGSELDRRRLAIFLDWFEGVLNLSGRVPVATLLDEALQKSGYAQRVFAQVNGRLVRANIEKLLGMLSSDMTRFEVYRAAEYLRWLRNTEAKQGQATLAAEGDEGEVFIGTVHAAKGLEWPLVALPDLNRKPNAKTDEVIWDENGGLTFTWLDPSTGASEKPLSYMAAQKSGRERESHESLRLLYVALTRAREWLILSSSLEIKEKDVAKSWKPESGSWLEELNKAFNDNPNELIGSPDNPGEITIPFRVAEPQRTGGGPLPVEERGTSLPVRRAIHTFVPPLKPSEFMKADDAEIRALKDALDSIPDLPPQTARRYLITASELATFERCPMMYEYRFVWQVPDRREFGRVREARQATVGEERGAEPEAEPVGVEQFELPASAWGTLCHELMQSIGLSAGRDEIRAAAIEVCRDSALDPESPLTEALAQGRPAGETFADRLTALAESALRLPLFERLRSCTEIRREYRLMGKLGSSDEVVLGVIDLLASCDGRPIVVDYKSGHIEKDAIDERVKSYELQVAIYAHLAAAHAGVKASDVEAHIVFLDPSVDVNVGLDDDKLNYVVRVVDMLSEASLKNDFASVPLAERCVRCDFGDLCPHSTLHG
jgi:ATP-dependent helicase/nuclease subunit A